MDLLMGDTELILLNDGSGTKLNRSSEFLPLVLTLVSLRLTIKCTLKVLMIILAVATYPF